VKPGHYSGWESIQSMHYIRDEWGTTGAQREAMVHPGSRPVSRYDGAYQTRDLVLNSATDDL